MGKSQSKEQGQTKKQEMGESQSNDQIMDLSQKIDLLKEESEKYPQVPEQPQAQGLDSGIGRRARDSVKVREGRAVQQARQQAGTMTRQQIKTGVAAITQTLNQTVGSPKTIARGHSGVIDIMEPLPPQESKQIPEIARNLSLGGIKMEDEVPDIDYDLQKQIPEDNDTFCDQQNPTQTCARLPLRGGVDQDQDEAFHAQVPYQAQADSALINWDQVQFADDDSSSSSDSSIFTDISGEFPDISQKSVVNKVGDCSVRSQQNRKQRNKSNKRNPVAVTRDCSAITLVDTNRDVMQQYPRMPTTSSMETQATQNFGGDVDAEVQGGDHAKNKLRRRPGMPPLPRQKQQQPQGKQGNTQKAMNRLV